MATRPHKFSELWLDKSGEACSFSLYVPSTVDIEATTPIVAFTNLIDEINTFMDVGDAQGLAGQQVLISVPLAAAKHNGSGNREDKFLIEFHDTVNAKRGVMTIPMRNPSIAITPGTDLVSLAAGGPGASLKSLWDALPVLSVDGNPTILDQIKLVGRNI